MHNHCCLLAFLHSANLLLESKRNQYVELLYKYFGNVCELDNIYNPEKAYFILDEFLIGGEIQETSKMNIVRAVIAQDIPEEPEGVTEEIFQEYSLFRLDFLAEKLISSKNRMIPGLY